MSPDLRVSAHLPGVKLTVVPNPSALAGVHGTGLRASAEAVHAVVHREVGLSVRVAGPMAAWVLLDGRHDGPTPLVNWGVVVSAAGETTRTRFKRLSTQIAALFPQLQAMAGELPAGHQVGVAFSGPPGALGALSDLMRDGDTMSFVSPSAGDRAKHLTVAGVELCDELLEVAGCTHVVVATDGSVERGRRGAGAGWVNSWGEYGHLKVDTSDIRVAEVAAIAHALSHTSKTATRVTVRADSRAAIAVAIQALRFGPTTGPVQVPAKMHQHVVAIHEAGKRLTVRVEWVRAHNGDPMNETADRLAVLARRAIRAQLDPAAVEETAQQIVADHLAAVELAALPAAA